MKSKVRFSNFATVLTMIINAVLILICCLTVREKPVFFTVLSILIVLMVIGLMFSPLAIEANEKYITVVCLLKKRRLPMANVASVELYQPTMGTKRIFGSGGYMGYWGIFSEHDTGRYMAYFGKASDCFLVRMKNGDKYVLGCESPAPMVDYINSHLSA